MRDEATPGGALRVASTHAAVPRLPHASPITPVNARRGADRRGISSRAGRLEIGKPGCVVVLSAAVQLICSPPPAIAANFDGNWSMVAETTRGHCGTIAMGLGISRGRIYATAGSFAFYPIQLAGRVSSSGHVQMNAVAGPRTAHGTGRFGPSRGSGSWAGRGPSGLCSGVWSASRS